MSNHKNTPGVCVAVTGIGSFSAIGRNASEMAASLREGRSGMGLITLFDTTGLKVKHAAEVANYNPRQYFSAEDAKQIDRSGQFALLAAREAVADSKLDFTQLSPDRTGIVCGVCSGSFSLDEDIPFTELELAKITINHVRHLHTALVAKEMNIRGVQASISTACASSTNALIYAFELLQSRKADVILVGGADGLLRMTYAGFYSLGAMGPNPCSPFSTNLGVGFGEGAGFVVLESLEHAKRRGAHIYGELAGYGCTADAYHITSPHPSGEGLRRAMEAALNRSGATVDDISYVNAHGTGTRDNDTAESLALSDLCEGKRVPPPMSSTKAATGHTLGAAGILEFIACIIAMRDGFLPPTLQFEAARPGCDLDYVPNHARKAEVNFFLSNSAAFGGVNAVVSGRRIPIPIKPERKLSRVVITGIGVVSPAGCGLTEFRRSLLANQPAFTPLQRFDVSNCSVRHAAQVRDFKPRQLTPTLDVRRLDLLNQYACVSAGLAYSDACLTTRPPTPERIGSVLAVAAGPLATQEAFEKSLADNGVEGVSAKYFPAIVLSTVGGQICQTLQLKGMNSTLVDGLGAGLPGAVHAFEMLRASEKEDQVILVAPDELSRGLFRSLDLCGLLADHANPYHADSRGFTMGEGSFALLLERKEVAEARGARIYAEILGYGANFDSRSIFDDSIRPEWLERCISDALDDADMTPDDIDFAVGLGNGLPLYDKAERAALKSVLSDSIPISLPVSLLGFGLASSGAAGLAVGALGLTDRQVYLPAPGAYKEPTSFRNTLVFGGSETGSQTAIVLGVPQ